MQAKRQQELLISTRMAVSLILGYFYLFLLQCQELDRGFCACQANSSPGNYTHNPSVTAFMSRRYGNFHVVCGLLDRSIGINFILPNPGLGSPDPHSQGSNFGASGVWEGEWGAVQTPTCSEASGFKANKEKTVDSLWYFINLPAPRIALCNGSGFGGGKFVTHSLLLHPSDIICSLGYLILGC